MEEIKKLLLKDIEEREILKLGIKRVRRRQTVLSVIGVFILIMFSINFVQTTIHIRKQNEIIQMLNDVVHAGRLLIEAYDEQPVDSLNVDYLPKK